MSDTIKVVTLSRHSPMNYWRVSIYEFRGDPPVAYFYEDGGVGSWDYINAVRIGKELAAARSMFFLENISMGNSIQKIYCKALS